MMLLGFAIWYDNKIRMLLNWNSWYYHKHWRLSNKECSRTGVFDTIAMLQDCYAWDCQITYTITVIGGFLTGMVGNGLNTVTMVTDGCRRKSGLDVHRITVCLLLIPTQVWGLLLYLLRGQEIWLSSLGVGSWSVRLSPGFQDLTLF